MANYALAIAFALFLWWFSTGVILYFNSLPRSTYRRSIAVATGLMLLLLLALHLVRGRTDLLGAYVGFTAGVLIWGWLEMIYFMGFVTGPHKQRCPPDCRGWRRFKLALGTSLYHELLLLLVAALIVALSWRAPNQIGLWAFVILWWMRWSAKLNLFLGVPNLNEDWLPDHVRFITSYLRKRPMNPLFPVSVSVATVVMSLLVEAALDLPAASFLGTGLILAATLLALAVLEHWFLVLPLGDGALWNWARPDRPPSPERPGGGQAKDSRTAGRGDPGASRTDPRPGLDRST